MLIIVSCFLLMELCFSLILQSSSRGRFTSSPLKRSLTGSVTSTILSSVVSDYEETTQEKLQSWYSKNRGRETEIFVSNADSKSSVIAEAWKSVLISLRVLDDDVNKTFFSSTYVFENIPVNSSSVHEYSKISQSISKSVYEASPLFQQEFERTLEFIVDPIDGQDGGNLMMISETKRSKPKALDFIEVDDSPDVEEEMAFTNDLECFPFPTVMDFVSEINRPVDPITMNELKFTFKPQDFKYDLVQMAKKKNPQKVVDSINCKLTRLQNWRDILSNDPGNLPDPFTNPAEWSAGLASKYKSLKAMAGSDPKGFLNTQYDKRTTFIKIIDLWSDRLKRSFKYIYQSQRPPEDFITPIMDSKWRNEIINNTRLFAQIPFLDFQGPIYEPGSPVPLFNNDQEMLFKEDYKVEKAMVEMLVWFRRTEEVNSFLGSEISSSYLGPISQHTYSRGYVTERTMHDTWLGLERWLKSIKNEPNPKFLNSDEVLGIAKGSDEGQFEKGDHTEDFIQVLQAVNLFTRESSVELSKSVKEMYRDWYKEGKEMSDWWTTTVRNLDLTSEMTEKAEQRKEAWSSIMDDIAFEQLSKDEDKFGENAEEISNKWLKFRPLMENSEFLEELLPWKELKKNHYTSEGLEHLNTLHEFSGDVVHVPFALTEPASSSGSVIDGDEASTRTGGYLFVCPRYFRGVGLAEEFNAFLEYCKIVATDMKLYSEWIDLGDDNGLEVIPLHPLMINQKGAPDYGRRTPHPAILFRIIKKI
mmetsp:Transcript_27792/g.26609  ORF Transcript_27792/g.26609 Transcript_27792/m.26609 type:complete len:756 (-) Transcript_27792:447-2714(-)